MAETMEKDSTTPPFSLIYGEVFGAGKNARRDGVDVCGIAILAVLGMNLGSGKPVYFLGS